MKPTMVTTYNNVDVYVNKDGTFYCDLKSNSDEQIKATFKSERLDKIINAIEAYQAPEITNGEEYYYMSVYSETPLIKLKVVKQVGKLLFFDNGESSKKYLYNTGSFRSSILIECDKIDSNSEMKLSVHTDSLEVTEKYAASKVAGEALRKAQYKYLELIRNIAAELLPKNP